MKSEIHREGLMFKWRSKDYQIVVGFKRTKYGSCKICKKRIPFGSNICDECFKKEKSISKK